MSEKWFGEKCRYQICKFEKWGDGLQDKSEPILTYCYHEANEMDCEGNCVPKLCPMHRTK